ncbi:hypothetical protein L1987_20207 [Smallanthus sonchifolius]|uniref:Uncharacterized protein n=1 Tax=Smallanthus sonchifolius TaxID=185202 RepID=A0ACB9IT11_9ASTR|nr:hypothetical protein L1987_20207 [Smallanthus sonchifolius]
MESRVTFLYMLHIHSFVMKRKEALEIDFENLVKWFINKVLNIQSEKPFPPELSNGVEVKLLKLYMLVKEEGGYNKWYYIKTKKNKINIRESSSSGESKFKKRRVSMVNKQEKDEMNGEESKGHKEESENEDVVVEDSNGIEAKGLESHEEWDSKSSRAEEDGVPGERRSRDDRLRVMGHCKYGLNKQDAAKRVVGDVEAFKGEPGVRVNETEIEKCSFSNNKVKENATRGSSVTEKIPEGMSRITIGLEKRCLDSDTCEKIMEKKSANMKGFNCHSMMFNSGIKAKGLESHEEWDSKSSCAEEDGVPGEIGSRDDRLRVRPEGNMANS